MRTDGGGRALVNRWGLRWNGVAAQAPTAAVVLAAVTCGCALDGSAVATFRPTAHLETTTPRTRAENGLGRPLLPPADVGWRMSLTGVAADSAHGTPSYRYELDLLLEDRRPDAGAEDLAPLLDGAELVDDLGRRFPAARMAWLESDRKQEKRDRQEGVRRRHCVVVFDLPTGYAFRHVVRATVHWGLRLRVAGAVRDVFVSTRFEPEA